MFCPHLVLQSQTFEWDTNNSFHTKFKNSWQTYFAIIMRQTRINDVYSLKIKLKEGMQYRDLACKEILEKGWEMFSVI